MGVGTLGDPLPIMRRPRQQLGRRRGRPARRRAASAPGGGRRTAGKLPRLTRSYFVIHWVRRSRSAHDLRELTGDLLEGTRSYCTVLTGEGAQPRARPGDGGWGRLMPRRR